MKKLLKQINNLKAVVKKKTDISATGNKKIKLSKAEQYMLDAMNGGTRENCEPNPVLQKVPGRIEVGVGPPKDPEPSSSRTHTAEIMPPPPKPKRTTILSKYETEETKTLTTAELQRLVLSEQLEVLRMKKAKLNNEASTLNNIFDEDF
ncbi:hypothetical protein Zmor_017489 [Zophobas morio]|uniref:Uncharacterized protein n=1 Tax=Zophobas morio TaxID=2755281 RepID=A0AA38IBI3_9CUCU|nr:hypothetical protein Zmor_017489 [Zophobas morio]